MLPLAAPFAAPTLLIDREILPIGETERCSGSAQKYIVRENCAISGVSGPDLRIGLFPKKAALLHLVVSP
jgi:hypothetical protein